MTGNDWKTETYGYHWLRKQAADHDHLTSAMGFLKAIGVVPEGVDYRRSNIPGAVAAPQPDSVPAEYLAGMAVDWDSLGESEPRYFIEALEFECAGTAKRDAVATMLAELGAENLSDAAIAAAA